MKQHLPSRKPEWLRIRVSPNTDIEQITSLLRTHSLHTVCEEADCPNRTECFQKRTATFMILGNHCTRNCTFCTVTKEAPCALDPSEPQNVAEVVKQLELRHVVITSVTRDDLPDGGARHFADVIRAIKSDPPTDLPIIEVLIPDFQGDENALMTVINAEPNIINHNIETVPRLYPKVRPMATYKRSLELLARVKKISPQIYTKSGLMVGLGESHEEVLLTLSDLRKSGCEILTIGQYLAPSKIHHPVFAYITPEEFNQYRQEAESLGFLMVASAPLVRSSYMAAESFDQIRQKG